MIYGKVLPEVPVQFIKTLSPERMVMQSEMRRKACLMGADSPDMQIVYATDALQALQVVQYCLSVYMCWHSIQYQFG